MFLTVAVSLGILSLLLWNYTSSNIEDQLEESLTVLCNVRHEQLEEYEVITFYTVFYFYFICFCYSISIDCNIFLNRVRKYKKYHSYIVDY